MKLQTGFKPGDLVVLNPTWAWDSAIMSKLPRAAMNLVRHSDETYFSVGATGIVLAVEQISEIYPREGHAAYVLGPRGLGWIHFSALALPDEVGL